MDAHVASGYLQLRTTLLAQFNSPLSFVMLCVEYRLAVLLEALVNIEYTKYLAKLSLRTGLVESSGCNGTIGATSTNTDTASATATATAATTAAATVTEPGAATATTATATTTNTATKTDTSDSTGVHLSQPSSSSSSSSSASSASSSMTASSLDATSHDVAASFSEEEQQMFALFSACNIEASRYLQHTQRQLVAALTAGQFALAYTRPVIIHLLSHIPLLHNLASHILSSYAMSTHISR